MKKGYLGHVVCPFVKGLTFSPPWMWPWMWHGQCSPHHFWWPEELVMWTYQADSEKAWWEVQLWIMCPWLPFIYLWPHRRELDMEPAMIGSQRQHGPRTWMGVVLKGKVKLEYERFSGCHHLQLLLTIRLGDGLLVLKWPWGWSQQEPQKGTLWYKNQWIHQTSLMTQLSGRCWVVWQSKKGCQLQRHLDRISQAQAQVGMEEILISQEILWIGLCAKTCIVFIPAGPPLILWPIRRGTEKRGRTRGTWCIQGAWPGNPVGSGLESRF